MSLQTAICDWPPLWDVAQVSVEGADAADEAMSRYADGDDAAFDAVYRALAGRLTSFLLRMVRSRTLAEDLLQETFLRMHRARGSFQRGARVVPWSYAIARNACVDHMRLKSVRRERPTADDALPEPVAGPQASGEERAIGNELADRVTSALSRMPENQREAFILLRFEGLSVAEAADVVDATEGAVKLRAFHAYEKLRAELGIKKRGES